MGRFQAFHELSRRRADACMPRSTTEQPRSELAENQSANENEYEALIGIVGTLHYSHGPADLGARREHVNAAARRARTQLGTNVTGFWPVAGLDALAQPTADDGEGLVVTGEKRVRLRT